MSKIICDVCGTSYLETAEQCPICGCVRPADPQGVISDGDSTERKSGYTYVKGGRFSKANVRKRTNAAPVTYHSFDDQDDDRDFENEENQSNTGLIVTALILLLAIIAVVIFITVRFFGMSNSFDLPEQTTVPNTSASVIACTRLTLSDDDFTLPKAGSAWMINPEIEPSDTTDAVTYTSSDESVATVSENGKVTAVGPGEAVITVSCGNQKVECHVVCDFAATDTDTTEDTTEATTDETGDAEYTEDDIKFKSPYNPPEVTLRYEGEKWSCYKGNIPIEEITWKSDDESVVTVKDGIVVAVGKGDTRIHAIWGEFDVECIVHCRFVITETGIQGSDNVGEG